MYKPFFCFVVAVSLVGCRQRENVAQLKALSNSLQYANEILKEGNHQLSEALISTVNDPSTHSLGIMWEPRGNRIKKKADSIVEMIEDLKANLPEQKDRNYNGAGNTLLIKLSAFKDSLPEIIHVEDFKEIPFKYVSIKKDVINLNKIVPLLPGYTDSLNDTQRKKYAKGWLEENFSGTSPAMAMVVLNRIESDLLTTTKTYMDYCLSQTVVMRCGGYTEFHPLASLSSSYVKQGQSVEVTAGIGSFSAAMRPQIFINGKEISLTDYATAVHRFTASGKPGKHNVAVKIKFTKPDGSIATVERALEYIIADEK